jgi:hypothetical protein
MSKVLGSISRTKRREKKERKERMGTGSLNTEW